MTSTLSAADRTALGLAAGLIGTIVMTLGQKAEMALTRRPPSTTPAKAVEQVAGVELNSRADEERASTAIHYAYGTALGGALALLGKIREPARTAAFFALAYGGGAGLLSALKLAPPPTRQKPAEVATDLGHHLVYALASVAAFATLADLVDGARRQ